MKLLQIQHTPSIIHTRLFVVKSKKRVVEKIIGKDVAVQEASVRRGDQFKNGLLFTGLKPDHIKKLKTEQLEIHPIKVGMTTIEAPIFKERK